jgi:hypothetical protein
MASVWDAFRGSGTPGTVVIEGVCDWEVRLWVQSGLNAVRGSLTANRSPKRPTEPNACLVSVEELIGVLLQQAGRAEKAYSSRGDVISRELEGSKHSAAVEERPSDVTDAFNADPIREASKMGCRGLIQRPDEAGSLI